MSYHLGAVGVVHRTRLAEALAALAGTTADEVEIAEESRDLSWSVPVSCERRPALGDVTWWLDIMVADGWPAPAPPSYAAALAEKLGRAMLYEVSEINRPDAYWLVTPEGWRTRARLAENDLPEEATEYLVDTVERAWTGLPATVTVGPIPEVIRGYPIDTPVTDAAGAVDPQACRERDRARWLVRNGLAAWEALAGRMAAGWPPDGWYPADYYLDDLEFRDELAEAAAGLPMNAAQPWAEAICAVDQQFTRHTRVAAPEDVAASLGLEPAALAGRAWWWRRLPDPLPWPWPDAPRP